jgi:hypothetical protein
MQIVMHANVDRSVVTKNVCNDRINALTIKAEPVSKLLVQVYMPTLENKDEELEKLYDIINEILEEDGKGKTNTIIMVDWNSVDGDNSY